MFEPFASLASLPSPSEAGRTGNFELHLTTRLLNDQEIETFREVCKKLSCKPLIIELPRGESQIQPMASIRHIGRYIEAWNLANTLHARFNESGFALSRIKIEVDPATTNGSLLLRSEGGLAPYFEWHGKVSYHQPEALLRTCLAHKAHLSRNGLWNEQNLRFVTLRDESGEQSIKQRIDALKHELLSGGWPLHKEQLELCLLDTTPSIDIGWLPQ